MIKRRSVNFSLANLFRIAFTIGKNYRANFYFIVFIIPTITRIVAIDSNPTRSLLVRSEA